MINIAPVSNPPAIIGPSTSPALHPDPCKETKKPRCLGNFNVNAPNANGWNNEGPSPLRNIPKNKMKYLRVFMFSGLFGVDPTMKSAIPIIAIDKNKINPDLLVYLSPRYPAPTVVTPLVAWFTVFRAPIVVLLNPRLVAITGRIADLSPDRYKCLKVWPEIIVAASLMRPWFTSKFSGDLI